MAKKSIPKPHLSVSAIPKHIQKPREFVAAESDGNLRVRFGVVDVGGPWCITEIDQAHFVDLLARVKSFEMMSCKELFSPGSEMGKVYQVADLPCVEAQQRLIELDYDDQTEIARLRISGARRLYGFLPKGGPDFYVLWWDPLHSIWPSSRS